MFQFQEIISAKYETSVNIQRIMWVIVVTLRPSFVVVVGRNKNVDI